MTARPPPDMTPLAKLGANKRLGQHFLHDLNITRRIVRSCGSLTGKDVIEIGSGPGGLTRALLESPARRIIAIEKDHRYATALQGWPECRTGRLQIIAGDALDMDPHCLVGDRHTDPHDAVDRPHTDTGDADIKQDVKKDIRPKDMQQKNMRPKDIQKDTAKIAIVANLPYNISTPLMLKWTPFADRYASITLTLQKEVALRLLAEGGKNYSRFSVALRHVWDCRKMFDIAASAFIPRPKVTSSVVRLTPRTDSDPHLWKDIVVVAKAAFSQRRKTLRRALSTLTNDSRELCEKAMIDPSLRAEELSIDDYRRLALAWSQNSGIDRQPKRRTRTREKSPHGQR